MTEVFLGLGSNKGFGNLCPLELLRDSCRNLSSLLLAFRASSIYKTGAMYFADQDDFLNMVVCGMYKGSAAELLDETGRVEAKFGRDRKSERRNGPRTLDIDIELFGDQLIKTKHLTVPHERLFERRFVLEPLLELLRGDPACSKERIAFFEEKLSEIPDAAGQRVQLLCALEV